MRRRMHDAPLPRLWSPPLTHYAADGAMDLDRMRSHWRTIRQYAGGFLVPGTAGDGWELTDGETDAVIDFALDFAAETDTLILIGLLQPNADSACRLIARTLPRLLERSGLSDPWAAMKACRVYAFATCPPRGPGRSQEEMHAALAQVLGLDLPTAIYHIPKVTQSELAPETALRLADEFPNFLFVKDSSGLDRLAPALRAAHPGITLLRGAEGDYADWLTDVGGPYDGFLLGSTNACGRQVTEIISLIEQGKLPEARTASEKQTRIVRAVADCVKGATDLGNNYTSANKILDHFMAWGSSALDHEAPMLHMGKRIPVELLEQVGQILDAAGLIPTDGYV
jgi:dihydrodipicolinate synthase/N-acetylneuraminate lyase